MAVLYCSANFTSNDAQKKIARKIITIPFKEASRGSLLEIITEAKKHDLLILLYEGSILVHQWVAAPAMRMNRTTAQVYIKTSSPEAILIYHEALSSIVHSFDNNEKISFSSVISLLKKMRCSRMVESDNFVQQVNSSLMVDGTKLISEIAPSTIAGNIVKAGGLVFSETFDSMDVFSKYNESMLSEDSKLKIQEIITFFQMGENEKGYIILERLLKLKHTRSMPELYVLKATIELNEGKINEALQSVLCAIQHRPEDQNVRALFKQIWDSYSNV